MKLLTSQGPINVSIVTIPTDIHWHGLTRHDVDLTDHDVFITVDGKDDYGIELSIRETEDRYDVVLATVELPFKSLGVDEDPLACEIIEGLKPHFPNLVANGVEASERQYDLFHIATHKAMAETWQRTNNAVAIVAKALDIKMDEISEGEQRSDCFFVEHPIPLYFRLDVREVAEVWPKNETDVVLQLRVNVSPVPKVFCQREVTWWVDVLASGEIEFQPKDFVAVDMALEYFVRDFLTTKIRNSAVDLVYQYFDNGYESLLRQHNGFHETLEPLKRWLYRHLSPAQLDVHHRTKLTEVIDDLKRYAGVPLPERKTT